MRALQASKPGIQSLEVVEDRPQPIIAEGREDHVIVKVEIAALNPVDWKMLEYNFFVESWPFCPGCDMAGTIVEMGPRAQQAAADSAAPAHGETPLNVGDRVWAFTGLGKPFSGTLAEFVSVPASLCGRIPPGMSFESASTIGVGSLTAARLCWSHLEAGKVAAPVMVYGAATSVGQYAVQLCKNYSCRVVAVASKKNHDLLRGLGANQVVDYHDDDWKEQITQEPENRTLAFVVDCVGGDATELCAQVLSMLGTHALGGHIVSVMPGDVKSKPPGTSGMPKVTAVGLGQDYDDPTARATVGEYVTRISKLLGSHQLVPNRAQLVGGGLGGVKKAMEEMKAGKVHGEKLVVRVAHG
eukprot:jgi/Mesvir1/21017/Mv08072-RA.1